MKVISLDDVDMSTLHRLFNGEDVRKTDHLQVQELHRKLRPPTGIAYSDWELNHASINGARLYAARPRPHPVGIKAGTDNLDDKNLGWMEDTERYPQYQSYGSPAERSYVEHNEVPKMTAKRNKLYPNTPRINFNPTTKPFGRY